MKHESLQALLIDRELGELPPEAIELLEAWLAGHPDAAAEAAAIRRTLETASAAVRCHPELARTETDRIKPVAWRAWRPRACVRQAEAVWNVLEPAFRRRQLFPLGLAVSILVVAGVSAWLGYRTARDSAPSSSPGQVAAPPTRTAPDNGPWARYAIAADPRGGLTVVRHDANPPL